jgi:hypothetical protein
LRKPCACRHVWRISSIHCRRRLRKPCVGMRTCRINPHAFTEARLAKALCLHACGTHPCSSCIADRGP